MKILSECSRLQAYSFCMVMLEVLLGLDPSMSNSKASGQGENICKGSQQLLSPFSHRRIHIYKYKVCLQATLLKFQGHPKFIPEGLSHSGASLETEEKV